MPAQLVYDQAKLTQNVESLCARLPGARLYYALKACAEPPVLAALSETGVGFEVASVEEFEALMALNVDADRIICGLPLKGPALVQRLHAAGCDYFVFDCPEEYLALADHAPAATKVLRMHVSDIDPSSASWGMEREQLDSCLQALPRFAEQIDGVTFHLARNYRVRTLERVLERVEAWLGLLGDGGPRFVNIGGGYRPALPGHLARKYDLDAFYGALARRIEHMASTWQVEILAEPGRGVVESAGRLHVLAMQVRARGPGQIEVAVELNIGVRPGAHPSEVAVLTDTGREVLYDLDYHLSGGSEAGVTCSFIDATCEYDVFYCLPLRRAIRTGEQLEFVGLGAYTSCLSSRFHGRSPPAVRVEPP